MHPDEYAEYPRCQVPGCDGFIREDKCRTRKGPANDAGENCWCEGVPHPIAEAVNTLRAKESPHRKGTKGCQHEVVPF